MKECNSCGKCCTKYSDGGLYASEEEIEYWQEHRPDIYRFVSKGNIWMSPDSGQQILRCPWLEKVPDQEKYLCAIYFDRPDDCKHYPVTISQMLEDECEMLEAKDLKDHKLAQQRLDVLMIDSRPPAGGKC
jgi:Fe-S-cluster containining protein